MMKIGSLFSGAAGLDMAVERLFDAEIAWLVEHDPAPSKILAHNYPNVPNYGDVTTIDWDTVAPVDIITGGSPCQSLSAAGKRAGMTEGTRSNLWINMREAIATLKPKHVVWENVRGARSAWATSESDVEPRNGQVGNPNNLRALGRVLGDLHELGYNAEWGHLRASQVGACHQRERVFILATLTHPHRDGLQAGQLPTGQR